MDSLAPRILELVTRLSGRDAPSVPPDRAAGEKAYHDALVRWFTLTRLGAAADLGENQVYQELLRLMDDMGEPEPPAFAGSGPGSGGSKPACAPSAASEVSTTTPTSETRPVPDRPWKAAERRAAALFGGRRFAANTGGAMDFETEHCVGEVKHVRRLSLRALEALALEMERVGFQRTPVKCGVVVVKRRAGRGRTTPRLIVLTEAAWRALTGGMR